MVIEDVSAVPERGALPATARTRAKAARIVGEDSWVALTDRYTETLLRALTPGFRLVVAGDRQSLVGTLRLGPPKMVILVCPPAGRAEMRLVARERELRSGLRLVVLSDHGNVTPRLHALELGFDDAIDLSADPAEISARLSIAGQRGAAEGNANLVWVGPEAQLDLCARVLWRRGAAHQLRPRDFELLRFLIDRPGQAFTRRQLLEAWPGNHVSLRMIDVTIWRLRALIEEDASLPRLFVTVLRLGYRYDAPPIRR